MKIVITENNFASDLPEREVLAQVGLVPERYSCKTEEEMKEAGKDAEIVFVQFAPVNRAVLDAWTACRLIVRYGIGYDNVDVAYAAERGIQVCNVPAYCLDEVADHTGALILSSARKIVAMHEAVKRGEWNAEGVARPMPKSSDTVVGLIGYGRIGERVSARLKPFGFQVVVFDPYLSDAAAESKGVRKASDWTAFLAEADILSMHVPLTDETRHMINEQSLKLMKRSAVVVNTSRGALIDTHALAKAIDEGIVGGAALDVFEHEPLEANHPLRSCRNVILTPHAAYFSDSALLTLQRQTAEEAVRYVKGEAPASPVNRPVKR
ncbi:C-terminal binding protein [Paenibacillus cymbidii]|uniref:C-terminal binding protein n=1 Tax=Paenibacillus cymbidii TaxID=1639034 RepID=UPI001436B434|nr:C-terminal binding protein [Paenibacillus cymbidii]